MQAIVKQLMMEEEYVNLKHQQKPLFYICFVYVFMCGGEGY